MATWVFMISYSAGVSLSSFSRMVSGIPILPTSCRNAPAISAVISWVGLPMFSARRIE